MFVPDGQQARCYWRSRRRDARDLFIEPFLRARWVCFYIEHEGYLIFSMQFGGPYWPFCWLCGSAPARWLLERCLLTQPSEQTLRVAAAKQRPARPFLVLSPRLRLATRFTLLLVVTHRLRQRQSPFRVLLFAGTSPVIMLLARSFWTPLDMVRCCLSWTRLFCSMAFTSQIRHWAACVLDSAHRPRTSTTSCGAADSLTAHPQVAAARFRQILAAAHGPARIRTRFRTVRLRTTAAG